MARTTKRRKTGQQSPREEEGEAVTEEYLGISPERAKEAASSTEPPQTRQATRSRGSAGKSKEKSASAGEMEEEKKEEEGEEEEDEEMVEGQKSKGKEKGHKSKKGASKEVTDEPEMLKPDFPHHLINIDEIVELTDKQLPFFASRFSDALIADEIPKHGFPATYCANEIKTQHTLDFNELLNVSSYVNVVAEPEGEELAVLGTKVNLADQSVYPQSIQMVNKAINMIARLWNCPLTDEIASKGVFPGEACVGSSEACLLAGIAMKMRWRQWYMKKHKLSEEDIIGIRPNLITSSLHHACWEKFFRFFDVYPKHITPSVSKFKLDTGKIEELVDDKTIGVLCILGNHYAGQYDEVHVVDEIVEKINREKGYQVGIHVDAASGGFVAPFRQDVQPWDFRLENVLSINASGHKYGESCCGTGWIVWRQSEDLAEHVKTKVNYLGGDSTSHSLNFSRPASGVFCQMYTFLRLGRQGYARVCKNALDVTGYIREEMMKMKKENKPLFILLEGEGPFRLPVIAAKLNPELNLEYDAIDLQSAMAIGQWYVGAYKMQVPHPLTQEPMPLFSDQDMDETMFRIVVKSSLTLRLAEQMVQRMKAAISFLDLHGPGYKQAHEMNAKHSGHAPC